MGYIRGIRRINYASCSEVDWRASIARFARIFNSTVSITLESMRTRTETRGVLTIVLFHLNIQIIKVSLIIKVYKHIDNLISPLSLDYLYLIHQISSIFFFHQIDDKTILFVIYTN